MKKQSNMISQNLTTLRHFHKYSQEEVAEKIGVTRQAVAKWEGGETVPDILNCDALAELYNVSVDDLIHFNKRMNGCHSPKRQTPFWNRQSRRTGTDSSAQKGAGSFSH